MTLYSQNTVKALNELYPAVHSNGAVNGRRLVANTPTFEVLMILPLKLDSNGLADLSFLSDSKTFSQT